MNGTLAEMLAGLRGLDAHRSASAELKVRLVEIDTEAAGQALSDEAKAEFEATTEAIDKVGGVIAELEVRDATIKSITAQPASGRVEGPFSAPNISKAPDNIFDLAAYRQRANSVDDLPRLYRDGAMRAIEQMTFPTVPDASQAKAQLEKIIARHAEEDHGWASRHIIGTSDPVYVAAWADAMRGQGLTGRRLAVMQTYSDTDGGFSIPVEIDPTFINVSDGAANPIRAISRRVTTTGKTWSAITTAGVSASYAGERTTTGASDGAPSDLDDPTVTPVRADVSVDLSLEYLQDYGSTALLAEVGQLIADAKDVLEADKFILGDGSGEPEGIVAAIITDTTSLVATTTNDAFLLADIDKLIGQLPNRFRTLAKAKFVANNAILQLIPEFGTAGQDAGSIYDAQSQKLRGYAVYEASAMDDVTTDAKEILLFGDFNQFAVVDRLGLTTKPLDTYDSSGRPTGGTTIYAAWRNSTKVLAFNAFRLLKVA